MIKNKYPELVDKYIYKTYKSIFGLFNTISTSIVTYSLWQKSSKRYKLLGIFANIFILIYDIYLRSIMGVIFIIIALVNSILGYIFECNKCHLKLKKSML